MASDISGTTGTRGFGRVPLSNIVPFSYRDGMTYADLLYKIRDHVQATFPAEMQEILNDTINTVNAELVEMADLIVNGQDEASSLYAVFTSEIERRIMLINNKTGNVEIQRIDLNESIKTVIADTAWPDNHPIEFVATQDSVGGRILNFGPNISVHPALIIDPKPNGVTEFILYPDGYGNWEARPKNLSGSNEIQLFTLASDVTTITPDPTWDRSSAVHFAITQNASGGKTVVAGEGVTGTINVNPRPGTVTEFSLLPAANGGWSVAPEYVQMEPGNHSTRMGPGALGSAVTGWARNNNAVGSGALANLRQGFYNDMFGLHAGHYLDQTGFGTSSNAATRNSGFGSNTQRFNRSGRSNVSMGRNALQNNVSGNHNTLLGAGAAAGLSPLGLGGLIENQMPLDTTGNVGVGASTLLHSRADYNTAVGYGAAENIKNADRTVAIGRAALGRLDSNIGGNGNQAFFVDWSAEFNFADGTVFIKRENHGLMVGYLVGIDFPGFERQHLNVISTNGDSFILDGKGNTLDRTLNGTATIAYYTNNTLARSNSMNTALGASALGQLTGDEAYGNTGQNTALGFNALSVMQDGTSAVAVGGSTAIGANSKVSGVNQLQLGSETVTVYSNQALQLRSDSRDKTDIAETKLGLEFITKLRPVDYRLDMRADYFVYGDDGQVTEINEPDGSKKRTRIHHGLIAQDVQELINETGIDFGGFQDHKVNGGNDVLSIGYEELIAPLIKAIQELSAKVKELESK